MKTIQTVANWNNKTTNLLSPLILNFLILNTFDNVVTLIHYLEAFNTLGLVYLLYFNIYMAIVLQLDVQIKNKLNRIQNCLLERNQLLHDKPTIKKYPKAVADSMRIKLHEFAIYKEDFKLKIFKLLDIDMGFFLEYNIFIFTYAIIFKQTN